MFHRNLLHLTSSGLGAGFASLVFLAVLIGSDDFMKYLCGRVICAGAVQPKSINNDLLSSFWQVLLGECETETKERQKRARKRRDSVAGPENERVSE